MNYEEKRELRLQISQLLADEGLNQGKIKDMVEQEISNKVSRAVEQVIQKLNNETPNGDYVGTEVRRMVKSSYFNSSILANVAKEELKNRILKISLVNTEID